MRTIRSEVGRDLLSGDLAEINSVFYIYVSKVGVVNHVVTLYDFSKVVSR